MFFSSISPDADFLETIMTSLHKKFPAIKENHVPIVTGSLWLQKDTTVYRTHCPPVYVPHLVLTMSNRNVNYDFKAHSQKNDKTVSLGGSRISLAVLFWLDLMSWCQVFEFC